MKKNFWEKLKKKGKPIYALAPMAGVTDSAFRQICKEYGADVLYSEMASATALVYAPQKTLEIVEFAKKERPYVVQLFGSKPEHFAIATKIITEKVRPDGIDINFGCPVKKVQKQGAGAILMSNLKLSYEVIKSVVENTDLPVSVKCRAYVEISKDKKISVLDFLEKIKGLDVKALMIHGRSMAQGRTGEIDWEIIKEAKNRFNGIVLANGGIMDAKTAKELLKKTGADGLGIARGALGKPWIFEDLKSQISKLKSKEEIFKIALKHSKLAYKLKDDAGIREMRKHLCWYVAGLPGASELRGELVKVENLEQIKKILK